MTSERYLGTVTQTSFRKHSRSVTTPVIRDALSKCLYSGQDNSAAEKDVKDYCVSARYRVGSPLTGALELLVNVGVH